MNHGGTLPVARNSMYRWFKVTQHQALGMVHAISFMYGTADERGAVRHTRVCVLAGVAATFAGVSAGRGASHGTRR